MPKPPPTPPPKRSPRALEVYTSEKGLQVNVQRSDGSTLWCSVVIGPDGSLAAVPPNGEWLIDPPAAQMEGQQPLGDEGEP